MAEIVEIKDSNNLVAYLGFVKDYEYEITSLNPRQEVINALIRDMKWYFGQMMNDDEKEKALASFNIEELEEEDI